MATLECGIAEEKEAEMDSERTQLVEERTFVEPSPGARSSGGAAGDDEDDARSRGSSWDGGEYDSHDDRISHIAPLASDRLLGSNPSMARGTGGSRRHAKLKSSANLPLETFFSLFRVDPDAVGPEVLERMRWALASLKERVYQPGELVQREGDANSPNEMLVFVKGHVDVELSSRRKSSRASLTPEDVDAMTGAPAPAAEPEPPRPLPSRAATLQAPFFIGEERVLRGSWPTATYRVARDSACTAFVFTEANLDALVATGGFDLERTLRLRAFERTIAKHGMHTSVLRDGVFVDHMMAYLARNCEAENLRFLVDLMQFKRDFDARGGFSERLKRFETLWDAYMRPWDTMANVSAIDCDPALLEQVRAARDAAVGAKNTRRLMTVLDPVALRVKRDLDKSTLPAFVESRAYMAFIKERFPAGAADGAVDAARSRAGRGGPGAGSSRNARGMRKESSNRGAGSGHLDRLRESASTARRADGKTNSFKGMLRRMSVSAFASHDKTRPGAAAADRTNLSRLASKHGRLSSNRDGAGPTRLRATLHSAGSSSHLDRARPSDAASTTRPSQSGAGAPAPANFARESLREKLANMTSELEEIERRDSLTALDDARFKLLSRPSGLNSKRTTEHATLAAQLVKAGVVREKQKTDSAACALM